MKSIARLSPIAKGGLEIVLRAMFKIDNRAQRAYSIEIATAK